MGAGRLTDLLRCEVPIQLAPMGGVSVSPALPLAVARAGAHAMYPGLMHTPETLAPGARRARAEAPASA